VFSLFGVRLLRLVGSSCYLILSVVLYVVFLRLVSNSLTLSVTRNYNGSQVRVSTSWADVAS
jgi:hypothetical protein